MSIVSDKIKIGKSSDEGGPAGVDGGITTSSRTGFFGQKMSTLTGGGDRDLYPYLPGDLIGGSIPHIIGTEDEAVWNAASQACGTERVHFCYTVEDGRCWYLAAPSSSFASNPDSWCPLAAALPGNSEHWDRETVYLYEQDGAAVALRWEADSGRMQVFSGATRTILPRIQSMDANFVTINAEDLSPVPWKNMALMQEKLSRNIIMGLYLSGLALTMFAVMYWAGAFMLTNLVSPKLDEAQQVTRKATDELMIGASKALRSDALKHLNNIQQLNDILGNLNATFMLYEVNADGAVVWEALVPGILRDDDRFQKQFKFEVIEKAKDGRYLIRSKQAN